MFSVRVGLKNSLKVLGILLIIFSWKTEWGKRVKYRQKSVTGQVLSKKSGDTEDGTISLANGTCEEHPMGNSIPHLM